MRRKGLTPLSHAGYGLRETSPAPRGGWLLTEARLRPSHLPLPPGPSLAVLLVATMLIMALALWAYCFAVVFARVRVIILQRERDTAWARQLLPRASYA